MTDIYTKFHPTQIPHQIYSYLFICEVDDNQFLRIGHSDLIYRRAIEQIKEEIIGSEGNYESNILVGIKAVLYVPKVRHLDRNDLVIKTRKYKLKMGNHYKYRHIRGYSAICEWLDYYGAYFFEDVDIWSDNRLHVSYINHMPRLDDDNDNDDDNENNIIEDENNQDPDYVYDDDNDDEIQ